MLNPMLAALSQSQGVSQIKNLMTAIKMAQNPQMALQQLAAQNPKLNEVMKIVEENGGDAKAAFYKMAKEKGVDPNDILAQLR